MRFTQCPADVSLPDVTCFFLQGQPAGTTGCTGRLFTVPRFTTSPNGRCRSGSVLRTAFGNGSTGRARRVCARNLLRLPRRALILGLIWCGCSIPPWCAHVSAAGAKGGRNVKRSAVCAALLDEDPPANRPRSHPIAFDLTGDERKNAPHFPILLGLALDVDSRSTTGDNGCQPEGQSRDRGIVPVIPHEAMRK